MNIREYIFQHRAGKQAVHGSRFPAYGNVQKVLLLFDSDFQERNLPIKQMIRQLQSDGKDVTAWGYVDKKKVPISAVLRDYRILAGKDISWWTHCPKDYEIRDLQREHFDVVINLCLGTALPMRYINLYADTDYRIGLRTRDEYGKDTQVADMMIDVAINEDEGRDAVYLFDQILHYMRLIATKDA